MKPSLLDRAVAHPLVLSVAMMLIAISAACAQLGVSSPDTFDKKLVAGYAGVKAASDSVMTLYQSGRISADEARSASYSLHQVVAGLDTARSVAQTDPKGGDDRLALAITSLGALQTFLLQRQQQLQGVKP